MKEQHHEQLEALADIKAMMERSSRFLSLSGLGGIGVGIVGIVGTIIAYFYLGQRFSISEDGFYFDPSYENWGWQLRPFFTLWACLVLGLAIAFILFFTTRRMLLKGMTWSDKIAQQSLLNFLIPSVTGGLVSLLLLERGLLGIIAPMTLVFFGLSCVHISRYTFESVRYLGFVELILGLLAFYFTGFGLLFWGLGFGVSILLYGIILYNKYERFD